MDTLVLVHTPCNVWRSFYSKFNLLEDGIVSTVVREVDLVFNAETMGEVLRVHVNWFDTYIQRKWPN